MPDLGFLVLAGLVLWRTTELASPRHVWVLSALVAGTTLLKSTGLLLAAGVAVLSAVPFAVWPGCRSPPGAA